MPTAEEKNEIPTLENKEIINSLKSAHDYADFVEGVTEKIRENVTKAEAELKVDAFMVNLQTVITFIMSEAGYKEMSSNASIASLLKKKLEQFYLADGQKSNVEGSIFRSVCTAWSKQTKAMEK